MGTATFTSKAFSVAGNLRVAIGDVTLSSSYAAGGDTLAASALGLSEVLAFVNEGITSVRVAVTYDRANGKVLAYFPTGGASTAPTTLADPRTTVAVLTAGGTAVTASAATGPFSPALDPGRAKEVAATADLSTVVARFIFFGV